MVYLTAFLMYLSLAGHDLAGSEASPSADSLLQLAADLDALHQHIAQQQQDWQAEAARWQLTEQLLRENLTEQHQHLAQLQTLLAQERDTVDQQAAALAAAQAVTSEADGMQAAITVALADLGRNSLWRIHQLDEENTDMAPHGTAAMMGDAAWHRLADLRTALSQLAAAELASRRIIVRRVVGVMPDETSQAVEMIVAGTAAAWWRSARGGGLATVSDQQIRLWPLADEAALAAIDLVLEQRNGNQTAVELWVPTPAMLPTAATSASAEDE